MDAFCSIAAAPEFKTAHADLPKDVRIEWATKFLKSGALDPGYVVLAYHGFDEANPNHLQLHCV